MRWIPPAALLAAVTASLPAQKLEFEKYELPNGLQVILHEDHRLPVAVVNIWYGVGGKDERKGRSGFAHLFEHLMFMGTKRVPGSGFDEKMEALGAQNNASTGHDRTNYFSWGPAKSLPLLLWLEADRMESMGPSMTKEKLEKQRAVVLNERRESVDMRPYGNADDRIGHMLYAPAHPYHESVIGRAEDIKAATLQDVKDFHATFYVPNNAALVVAGDFDKAKVKAQIQELFASIPRGAVVPRIPAKDSPLPSSRRLELHDNVQFRRLTYLWKSSAFYAPGDSEADLAAAVLARGKSSRLYKRLVIDDKLVISVESYQWSRKHGGLFVIEAMLRPEAKLADVEHAIAEELSRLAKAGPTEAELARHKASMEYDAVTGLESLRARADRLNQYNFYLGDPGGFEYDLERYRKVDVASLRTWAAAVLDKTHRLSVVVRPKPKKAKNARDIEPGLGDAGSFAIDKPEVFRLANGIEVRHWKRDQLPLVRVAVYCREGALRDPVDLPGLTWLTASMLDEGAGDRDALAFGNALQEIGASLSSSADRKGIYVSVQALSSKLSPALALLSDAVQKPRFTDKDWQRVKSLHLQSLEQAKDNPAQLARVVASTVFYGKEHPYGRPLSGDVASVSRIQLEHVRDCYKSQIRPEHAVLFCAGAIDKASLQRELEKTFGKWKPGNEMAMPLPLPGGAPRSAFRVFLLDRPEAVQTVVRWMMPAPNASDPEREAFEAINTVLGGSFTSRLNQNIREKHGFAYGAGSGLYQDPHNGVLLAVSTVEGKHTGAAIREFLNEFRRLKGGDVSAAEATKAAATNRQTWVERLGGLGGLLAAAMELEAEQRDFGILAQRLAKIAAVDAEAMNKAAGRAIAVEHAALLVVGSKKRILPQLEGLALPAPIEVDADGKVLGKR